MVKIGQKTIANMRSTVGLKIYTEMWHVVCQKVSPPGELDLGPSLTNAALQLTS